ncbi:unnamed protein product [Linum trigynum]|uniref:START domain-containing protein n=1 Tax=Linum trigynum TaxID=586398 RepID=A0AAV2D9Z5_9ROSI
MENNGHFYQYRERLDRTLASPALTDLAKLKIIISKQLEGSDEKVIEKRAIEASNFLDMLRGAGVSENGDSQRTKATVGEWNLKESNEEFRVMYREGPQGTPMHTLFVEGFVDGPTDTCLCLGWESTLYHKWWPQLSFPNFKIAISKSLQKVRFGEQISLLRMKIAWPLSARESVLHYFMFEYLEEGLIVVLLNSIADSDSIDVTTHGYTRDGIPEPEDVVRMDLVGGFAVQRVNSNRSYVCLIGNIDFKLDFMPPSLINFVARQLIGGGYKLYQKAVISTSKHDKDYVNALKDPLYSRLRDIFREHSEEPYDIVIGREELNNNQSIVEATKVAAKSLIGVEKNGEGNPMTESFADALDDLDEKNSGYFDVEKILVSTNGKTTNMSLEACEIEHEAVNRAFSKIGKANFEDEDCTRKKNEDTSEPRYLVQYAIVLVCPDLNQAIGSLEKGISMVKRYGASVITRSLSRLDNRSRSSNEDVIGEVSPSVEKTSKLATFTRKHSTPLKDGIGPSHGEVNIVEVSDKLTEKALDGPKTFGSYINR